MSMRLLRLAIILWVFAVCGSVGEDISKYAQWITGDLFIEDSFLLFRADKPVKGNVAGSVVLIGTTKDLANGLGPLLVRAAERNLKLRVYGVLMRAAPHPEYGKGLPSVQFIVWKLHSPDDPDDIPPGEAIQIDPQTRFPEYEVAMPMET